MTTPMSGPAPTSPSWPNPGTRYLDWELDDPAGRPVETVRPVRDEIEQRVRALLTDLDVPVQV